MMGLGGHVACRWQTWVLKHSVLIPRPVFFAFCPEASSPATASSEGSQSQDFMRTTFFSDNSSVLLFQLLPAVRFFGVFSGFFSPLKILKNISKIEKQNSVER